MAAIFIQWKLSILDTLGTRKCLIEMCPHFRGQYVKTILMFGMKQAVLIRGMSISGVSVFQKCPNREVALFQECPYEGFHSIPFLISTTISVFVFEVT